jgi:hypothetical protein
MSDIPGISENQGVYANEIGGLTRRFGAVFGVDDLAGRLIWRGALLRRYAYGPD